MVNTLPCSGNFVANSLASQSQWEKKKVLIQKLSTLEDTGLTDKFWKATNDWVLC